MDNRLLKLNFKTILLALSDVAMPRVCVICHRHLTLSERSICLECLSDLPLTFYYRKADNPMAVQYNYRIGQTLRAYEPFQYAVGLFFYREGTPYAQITPSLKYGRNFDAGKYFAAMLGDQLCQSGLFKDVDLIIPVPLHVRRLMQRGYNQAHIIARQVQRRLRDGGTCAQLRTDVIARARYTRSQATIKSQGMKQNNVQGAFRLKRKDVEAHHILIVDDVFTTGSTALECHDTLRLHYGSSVRISIATLAVVE